MKCYFDADFADDWRDGDHDNPKSLLSITCFIVTYAGCPITWKKVLQIDIALIRTTKNVITFLNLPNENSGIFKLPSEQQPAFHYKVW